uniref:Uncharacterized protein n=1 Tax=Arundo donax TaxID=35708 RepID=A0A0A9EWU0_ARUDO
MSIAQAGFTYSTVLVELAFANKKFRRTSSQLKKLSTTCLPISAPLLQYLLKASP